MNETVLHEDYVCATDKYFNFTYGKIYRITIRELSVPIFESPMTDLIEIRDDRGLLTARYVIRDEFDFITLDEWRNRKLEQLGINI